HMEHSHSPMPKDSASATTARAPALPIHLPSHPDPAIQHEVVPRIGPTKMPAAKKMLASPAAASRAPTHERKTQPTPGISAVCAGGSGSLWCRAPVLTR